jgi:threonine/homoserine/homoserine lactone efflux protein
VPHLVPFLLVAALIVITPGPDMALVASNALNRGRGAALATAAGVCVGLLVWTGASAAGLAAVLSTSAIAFTAVKLAGAVYLVILGVQALIGAWRARGTAAGQQEPTVSERPAPPGGHQVRHWRPRLPRLGRSPFSQGLACNVLNPKIAVLFTSLIPQFVTPGPTAPWQSAGLAGVFVAMGLVWLTGFALTASAANGILRRPRVQRVQRVITGTALVGLGLRLAAEAR